MEGTAGPRYSHGASARHDAAPLPGLNGAKTRRRGDASVSPSPKKSGGVLLSQGQSSQVPSALEGLTSVFGMGTGVTPPLWPPKTCCQRGLIPRELQSEHEYRELMFEPSP